MVSGFLLRSIIYVGFLICFSIENIKAIVIFKRQNVNETEPCPFDSIVVFGDSTCDNGNTWRLSNFTYPPIDFFYKGRFSNGPTWVEYLAGFCHVRDLNYAYAGATTDNQFIAAKSGLHFDLPVPGIKQELNDIYLAKMRTANIDFNRTLYIVAHQGNDYLNEPTVNPKKYLPRPPKYSKLEALFKTLVARLITSLHNAAIDFYVLLFRLKHKDVHLYILPMNKIWAEFQQPKVKEELGITDFDHPCVVRENTTYTMCSNPEQHFYWDYIHPSTKVHRYVGYKAYLIVTGKA
ncbi:SGNH/GDSL hydrolase family protein [Rhizophagus clarus]|uniref:SGNH/GDSL hydrolase family protein n=1 Tax=Rhizophagus clarus TaxID=94130 RepID=A0A8H3R5L9_9GLOM|nr:SGNH/GDSL hydrolase family protein [Rhizophagus clarus]